MAMERGSKKVSRECITNKTRKPFRQFLFLIPIIIIESCLLRFSWVVKGFFRVPHQRIPAYGACGSIALLCGDTQCESSQAERRTLNP